MVDMFTPGKIGNLELKNRIVRSATWEALADREGTPTDKLIRNMVRLAEGEVGLIILGITAVDPLGRGMYGMSGIYSDAHLAGHARLVEAVHRAGGRISVQLAHVGAQVDARMVEGGRPVAPSAVLHPAFNSMPRALSTDEVKALVRAFGRSAELAQKAGYDAVQIHAAHGYLIDQFMSPRFNQRDDEYGEPGRFLMEVYDAIRASAGEAPVHVKLNLDDFLEGSTTPEVSLPLARALSDAGIDAIEVSGGTPASGKLNPSRKVRGPEDEAYFLELARTVKREVSCPVIGVGGYRSPELINRALAAGEVDFVSISRPLIREPGLIRRWMEGDQGPARCESCNRCFGTVKYGDGVQCMIEYRARKKQDATPGAGT